MHIAWKTSNVRISCLRLFMDYARVVYTCVPYSHANRTWQTYTLSFYFALVNFIHGLQEAICQTKMAITKHSLVFYSWWNVQQTNDQCSRFKCRMTFILKSFQISTLQLKSWFKSKTSNYGYRNEMQNSYLTCA